MCDKIEENISCGEGDNLSLQVKIMFFPSFCRENFVHLVELFTNKL